MQDNSTLSFIITNPAELNASLIPFLKNGGIFIPTNRNYSLGDHVTVEVRLPDKNDPIIVAGKVVWINPKNALHHAMPGIGIEFSGSDAKNIKNQFEKLVDKTLDVGSHVYGLQRAEKKEILPGDDAAAPQKPE